MNIKMISYLRIVADGCPAGQSVLMVNGVVQTCGGTGAPFCPTQYTCLQNTQINPSRFQCCGTPSTSDRKN